MKTRTNRIRLNESQLQRIIKESVKKVLREHEEDRFYDYDTAYIGRTDAYYSEEDDEDIYQHDLWTWDDDPNSSDFAGEVYQLNDDGKSELNWWIRCSRFNNYQRKHAFNPNFSSSEEMWNELTKNYGKLIRR